MKYFTITLIVLVIIGSLFYFTKPNDNRCREEAIKIVSTDMVKVPGYSDPNASIALPSAPENDKVVIKDKVLWKEVSYIYPGSVKKLGNAYLGYFHPGK
ncbi:MAG: hypothetical protein ABUT20_30090 [Bacteroidota bacterium]